MAQVPSEVQGVSPQSGTTDSENTTEAPGWYPTIDNDLDLRSVVEENAFQALSEGPLIKRPRYTLCMSDTPEGNDFVSLTFPVKLWKIVESDQFKSIWWDENGTSIVINEEYFKKEVLERKTPFKIFETDSMKSLVRQLNLYGFRKIRQDFQSSASLTDFLEEENNIPVFSKLLFYQNPNFKRGCPQLLVRMKLRVGIKHTSPPSASLVHNLDKTYHSAGEYVHTQNPSSSTETNEERLLSTSTNLNVPPTSHRIANSNDPVTSNILTPSSTLIAPSVQFVTNQHALLNQMTTSHRHSYSTYSQAHGHILNVVTTTTSISQFQILSPVQNNYFGLMANRPVFAPRHPSLATIVGPFSSTLTASNPWFTMPMIASRTAASPPMSTNQPSSIYQYPNFN
nr:heat shock transcription factor, Y-linked [Oryctolagus cuniculus]